MPRIEVNGVGLQVDEAGDGPALVLVHGSWVDRHTWAPVVEELALSYRVVIYDRRGHGDSGDDPRRGTRRDDEDDLAALITKLGVAPVHVVANSYGGSIALGIAARHPELVRSVCAHEPPLVDLAPDHPAVAAFIAAMPGILSAFDNGDAADGARRFLEAIMGPGTWELLGDAERAEMLRSAPSFAGELRDPGFGDIDHEALAEPTVPILLTRGGAGAPMFGPIVAQLSEAIPAAHVKVFAGAGHGPHVSHTDDWLGVVTGFVNGIEM